MRITFSLRVWFIGALATFAVCGNAQDTKTIKDVYERNSEAIRSGFQNRFESLQQQYGKSLEALKASAVKQGDLERAQAAITEIERFGKMKGMPASHEEPKMQEIKALQSAYVAQYKRLETDMIIQLGTLTENYVKALDRIQKELTKAEKLDDATSVLEEKKKAQVAVKGYADMIAEFKNRPVATNGTVTTVMQTKPFAQAAPSRKTDAKKFDTEKELYLVIDLSGGKDVEKYPVSYLSDIPKDGWSDKYKTEKLVMRKIEPGTFKMGSPEDEPGHKRSETQHRVRLTKGFYIGVFEVTWRQWELVMGSVPKYFKSPDLPAECVSYDGIRGSTAGAGWPASNSVDTDSFMGLIRAKTGLMTFDLPMESQWEYACRAGSDKPCAGGVNEMAWHGGNSGKQTHPVGQKLPNAWGLHDMHGNVWEWCLDWRGTYAVGSSTDPVGAQTGSERMRRGGSFQNDELTCRSACRMYFIPSEGHFDIGFRAAITLP